jgi:outer membrane protein insertion porin family/translocation and assembly module TamA
MSCALACSKIPPGRAAVDSVRILNAKAIRAGDVEEVLATQASPKFLFLFQGVAYDYEVYDESVLQRDMARVERFYRSKGFFDAHARVARVFPVKGNHVRVEILVDEGPPTVNRRITLVGLDDLPKHIADAVTLAARRALLPGVRFEEEKFKASESAVKEALTDRGYAYAEVDSQAEADIGEHLVDYGFRVVPGPPATFGPITIVGLDPDGNGPRKPEVPEKPLRRAIHIREGAPYSTAAIDSATQALLDLGVFSAVKIVPTLPDPPPPDYVVPLTVKVEPMRLRQITLGGGVEIDEIKTDLHVVAGWEDHNFLGGLRHFSATFKPGAVLYPLRINNWTGQLKPLPEMWLKTELRQPGFLEARTNGFIRPQFNIFPLLVEVNPPPDVPVVGYREVKLPVGVDRTFWKRVFVSLDYNLQIESPFAYVQDLDPSLATIVLSFPELVLHLDFRDGPVRPHEGLYIANTFSMAGGIFGGTATDLRVQPEVRTYVPIAHGLTFATRASVGFLWSWNYARDWNAELEGSSAIAGPAAPEQQAARAQLEHDIQIMYFRGFFSGGPTTNRGYPLLGVAPYGVVPFLNPATAATQVKFRCDPSDPRFIANECFLPVGGFTLWELQNEIRADISGPLSGTVFCDMSDVSPFAMDIRPSHLHLSCGVGAAYDTPVGPIRVDIGYRIQPLQVIGYKNETDAANLANPGKPGTSVNGNPPDILGVPIALAIGIGQAF